VHCRKPLKHVPVARHSPATPASIRVLRRPKRGGVVSASKWWVGPASPRRIARQALAAWPWRGSLACVRTYAGALLARQACLLRLAEDVPGPPGACFVDEQAKRVQPRVKCVCGMLNSCNQCRTVWVARLARATGSLRSMLPEVGRWRSAGATGPSSCRAACAREAQRSKAVPVCGADGVTYARACLALCQGTTVAAQSPCKPQDAARLDLTTPLAVQAPPDTMPPGLAAKGMRCVCVAGI
jgi:alkylhydroperoxidase family enzyme